jgi:hypothetical protein
VPILQIKSLLITISKIKRPPEERQVPVGRRGKKIMTNTSSSGTVNGRNDSRRELLRRCAVKPVMTDKLTKDMIHTETYPIETKSKMYS